MPAGRHVAEREHARGLGTQPEPIAGREREQARRELARPHERHEQLELSALQRGRRDGVGAADEPVGILRWRLGVGETRGARPGRPSTANCPGWNGGYVQPSGATRMMTSPGATSMRWVSTAFSSERATPHAIAVAVRAPAAELRANEREQSKPPRVTVRPCAAPSAPSPRSSASASPGRSPGQAERPRPSTTMPSGMLALMSAVAREAPVGRFGQADFAAYYLAALVVRLNTGAG